MQLCLRLCACRSQKHVPPRARRAAYADVIALVTRQQQLLREYDYVVDSAERVASEAAHDGLLGWCWPSFGSLAGASAGATSLADAPLELELSGSASTRELLLWDVRFERLAVTAGTRVRCALRIEANLPPGTILHLSSLQIVFSDSRMSATLDDPRSAAERLEQCVTGLPVEGRTAAAQCADGELVLSSGGAPREFILETVAPPHADRAEEAGPREASASQPAGYEKRAIALRAVLFSANDAEMAHVTPVTFTVHERAREPGPGLHLPVGALARWRESACGGRIAGFEFRSLRVAPPEPQLQLRLTRSEPALRDALHHLPLELHSNADAVLSPELCFSCSSAAPPDASQPLGDIAFRGPAVAAGAPMAAQKASPSAVFWEPLEREGDEPAMQLFRPVSVASSSVSAMGGEDGAATRALAPMAANSVATVPLWLRCGGSDADVLRSDSTSGVNAAGNNCAVSLSVSVKIRYRTNPSVPDHGASSDSGWLLREAALSVAVQPALRAT